MRTVDDALVGGYSGSPVLAEGGDVVVAVASEAGGRHSGIAIPVTAIKQIWSSGPIRLREDEYTRVGFAEIYRIMAGFIPDFAQRYPHDIRDKAISEVAQDKVFEVETKRALFFGRTGAGKSTTINCLLGDSIIPTTGEVNCTKSLVCGEHRGGLIVFDSPGMEDEGEQENITRLALGLEQRAGDSEDPIEAIPMLDLTHKVAEGPQRFKGHQIDRCVEGLASHYLSERETPPVCKEFTPADFVAWIPEKIDFFVFVLSSVAGVGISPSIGKVLAELYQVHGSTLQLFKVFNRFEPYDQGVERRFHDAKERLRRYGVPHAEEWVEINAKGAKVSRSWSSRLLLLCLQMFYVTFARLSVSSTALTLRSVSLNTFSIM
jgi:energy-coupling factor transporter ATP-binding protein EcfA2